MTSKEFDEILISRINKMQSTLASKATEYATDDRLHNFKVAASLQGVTNAQACLGFMTKHLVSILDMIRDDAEGKLISKERIDEKIGDAVNYLVLLEALFLEKQ